VAIKTLTTGQGERIQHEARAIAALNHPHICVLHDVGPDYLVMEYLEARPAGSAAARRRAARGLGSRRRVGGAHAKGVLHRDLKPANIM
jgi:serine/threonine protein kinase